MDPDQEHIALELIGGWVSSAIPLLRSLNVEAFETLLEAQVLAEYFRIEYNVYRPSLGTRKVLHDVT